MQRKPGYPIANCNIKMPEAPSPEAVEEEETPQRRQQLINFGHAQWGFNNWSWAVTKQDLDFVDVSCGKMTAGVAAFVSITVKTLDIRRENVGYATALAPSKGLAIHRARKCAVTNALRETLLSFGGAVASELLETDAARVDPPEPENCPALANRPAEPLAKPARKDEAATPRAPNPPVKNALAGPPPVAKALPMPANLPPAANRPRAPPPAAAPAAPHPAPHPAQHPAQHPRPNSNEADEARAERKRRQRLAQEEFRLKQLQAQQQQRQQQQQRTEDKREMDSISTSVDSLLMALPSPGGADEPGKRKSPEPAAAAAAAKRRPLGRLELDT